MAPSALECEAEGTPDSISGVTKSGAVCHVYQQWCIGTVRGHCLESLPNILTSRTPLL